MAFDFKKMQGALQTCKQAEHRNCPAIQSQGGIQSGFNFNKRHHPVTDM